MLTRLGSRFCDGDHFASVWRGERVFGIRLGKGAKMSERVSSGHNRPYFASLSTTNNGNGNKMSVGCGIHEFRNGIFEPYRSPPDTLGVIDDGGHGQSQE